MAGAQPLVNILVVNIPWQSKLSGQPEPVLPVMPVGMGLTLGAIEV